MSKYPLEKRCIFVRKISNNPYGNVLKKLGFMGVRETFWGLASTEFLLPPNSLVWGLSPQNPLLK